MAIVPLAFYQGSFISLRFMCEIFVRLRASPTSKPDAFDFIEKSNFPNKFCGVSILVYHFVWHGISSPC
jgi:hypothetical protein